MRGSVYIAFETATHAMIKVKSFVFNDFQENTYLLWDETGECVVVDPGCFSRDEQNELKFFIESNGLKPVLLLNTHCHIDHVLGNNFVAETWNLPVHFHREELKTYRETSRWTAMFGMDALRIPENPVFISENDPIRFGRSGLSVLLTPGHSIASLTFLHAEQKFALSGDVLFYESIGRTDLPGGNYATLISSIKMKLMVLGDDFTIYPGHGPSTTIGYERKHNPFLR